MFTSIPEELAYLGLDFFFLFPPVEEKDIVRAGVSSPLLLTKLGPLDVPSLLKISS